MWASLPLAISPEHCPPNIQFLFIGSRLCSTLLSDLTSRFGPCASLSLHLHLVVKRTCTSQLSIMLGTPKKKSGSRGCRSFRYRFTHEQSTPKGLFCPAKRSRVARFSSAYDPAVSRSVKAIAFADSTNELAARRFSLCEEDAVPLAS